MKVPMDLEAKTLTRLLHQIHEDFAEEIAKQTRGTPVPVALLAAMMPNEAGRFPKGHPQAGAINPNASRLEPHVLKQLLRVRDGKQKAYGKIVRADLQGIPDEGMQNLARSWGPLQVMGYWILRLFKDNDGTGVTIAELRDVKRHFGYCTQLLLADTPSRNEIAMLNEGLADKDEAKINDAMSRILRRWNTGSPFGTPYHGQRYVDKGIYCLYRWVELYGRADSPGGAVRPDLQAAVVGPEVTNADDYTVSEDQPPPVIDPEPETAPETIPEVPIPATTLAQVASEPETAAPVPPPVPIIDRWWSTATSIPAKVYGAITGGATLTIATLSEFMGFLNDNRKAVIVVSVICSITMLGLYLMKRRSDKQKTLQEQMFEMQKLIATIAADPKKTNVTMTTEAKKR